MTLYQLLSEPALLIKPSCRGNVVLFYFYTICLFSPTNIEWPWIQTLPGRARYCLSLSQGAALASPNPGFHWSFAMAVGCPWSPSIRDPFFLTSFFLSSPRATITCTFAMIFVVLVLPQVFSSTELYFSAKHPLLCEPTLSCNTPWLCSHPPSVTPAFQVHFALNFPGSFYKEVFHRQKLAQNTVFVTGQFHCNLKNIYLWSTSSSSP